MKKFLSLGLAGLIAATASVVAVQGFANANEDLVPYDFVACVKNSQTGSVVILMDESGSIYGAGDNEGSDPQNMRITGAQILIDDLQRVSDISNGQVKIQLAGLGDNFVSRSGGWVSLTPRDNATSEKLKQDAELAWKTRPADGNSRETDILSSLSGAQRVLQPETGCKLLVIFKDGKDWQYLNPAGTSPVDFPEVQAAVDAGNFIEAKRLALNEICRPLGIADGLRSSNVSTLAVALGSGSFVELQDLVYGNTCGERSGSGDFLNATNPQDLPSLFKQALDPNSAVNEFTGSFEFGMSSDLQNITILTSGLTSASDLKIQPPAGCPAIALPSASAPSAKGAANSSVQWQATQYGTAGTVQVRMSNTDRSNRECWEGNWQVTTGNEQAKTVVEVDPNLEAVATFEDQDVYLVPGSTTPTRFQVSLQQLTDGKAVPASSLGEGSRVSVDAFLVDENNNQIQVFSGGRIDRAGLEAPIDWTVPEDLAFGNYKLVLSTAVEVPGVNLKAKTVTWERNIEVRGEVPSPIVLNAPIDFGEIDGTANSTARVEIQNRSDKALIVLTDQIEIALEQAPEGLEYVITSEQSEVELPANGTANIELILTPQAERVDAFGSVAGDVKMMAAVADARNKVAPFSGEFFGTQKASADENARFWLIVIFMLLAALGTLLAIALVNYLASRFPKSSEVSQIQAFVADVNISRYGLELKSGDLQDRIYRDQWQLVEFNNRRSIVVDGVPIKAKSPGLRLSGTGFGLAETGELGFGSESPSAAAGSRIGLAIEGSYLIKTALSAQEIKERFQNDMLVDGQIVLLTSDRSSSQRIFDRAQNSPVRESLANLGTSPKKEKSEKPEKQGRKQKEPKQQPQAGGNTSPENNADDFWS